MQINSLLNRIELYKIFPKNAVGAELGVQYGHNAQFLYKLTEPKKLYLVDPWELPPEGTGKLIFNCVKASFQHCPEVEVIRAYDWDWIETIPDEHLDWVYLDSSHLYHNTKREVTAILPKIKRGGILAGHDFCTNPWWKTGVMRPILDAVQAGQIRITTLTEEAFPSYYTEVL